MNSMVIFHSYVAVYQRVSVDFCWRISTVDSSSPIDQWSGLGTSGLVDWHPNRVPSGKRLHSYGKIHHFQWENPL